MHIIGQFSESDGADSWGRPAGTLEFIVDQFEELIVSLIEEIRERPMVVAAIFAAIVGAILGGVIARARRPKPRVEIPRVAPGDLMDALSSLMGEARPRAQEVRKAVGKSVGKSGKSVGKSGRQASKSSRDWLGKLGFGDWADLLAIGTQLMENPLVRSYVRAALAGQLRRRMH